MAPEGICSLLLRDASPNQMDLEVEKILFQLSLGVLPLLPIVQTEPWGSSIDFISEEYTCKIGPFLVEKSPVLGE